MPRIFRDQALFGGLCLCPELRSPSGARMVRPIQPSGQTWRHSADPSSPSPLPDWLVFNDVPESKFCRPRHPNWCRAKLQLQLDRLKPVDPGTMKVEARHNLNANGVGPRHQRCQENVSPRTGMRCPSSQSHPFGADQHPAVEFRHHVFRPHIQCRDKNTVKYKEAWR